MYGVVKESVTDTLVACAQIQWEYRELTRQIGTFYQIDSNDAHQASHADQATQSKDAGQHELLTCFKFQPPYHE